MRENQKQIFDLYNSGLLEAAVFACKKRERWYDKGKKTSLRKDSRRGDVKKGGERKQGGTQNDRSGKSC